MTTIEALVQKAVGAMPNLTPEFGETVSRLASAVAAVSGVRGQHRSASDYSVCQMIEYPLDVNGYPVGEANSATYLIKVAVSSVAEAWTVLYYARTNARGWRSVEGAAALELVAKSFWACLLEVMEQSGLTFVSEKDLIQPVANAFTELDESPATVKDVLFCEIC